MKPLLTFLALSLLHASCLAQEQVPEKFTVNGTVRDADDKPVSNSVVVPLSEHGVPLNKSDATPTSMDAIQQANGEDFVLFTKTNEQGAFLIDLPPGKYRIGAQSWLDQPDVTDLMAKNGSRLRIDGFVEVDFKTEMQAAEEIEIRPIGTGSIRLTSQEASDMLFVSTKPLAGDPALGFMALTGGFWSGLIGGTRMKEKHILISGLPEGELQFYSFVNDNNGGWGGVKAEIIAEEQASVHLPVIAGWSNGHRTPPPELEDLFDLFQSDADEVAKLMNFTEELRKKLTPEGEENQRNWIEMQTRMAAHLQDEYELSNGDKVTLADAWAALAYHQMNR